VLWLVIGLAWEYGMSRLVVGLVRKYGKKKYGTRLSRPVPLQGDYQDLLSVRGNSSLLWVQND
jgi:hypothetical protein